MVITEETSPQSATIRRSSRNRHPVDELADIRAELKRLEAREAELKAVVMAEGCNLEGDEFEATVTRASAERVDTTAVRKHLGEDGIKPFLKRSETVTVRVKAIDRSYLAEVQ